MAFGCLFEYVIEDLVEFILYIFCYVFDVFDYELLDEIMNFFIIFMGNMVFVKNLYL